MNKRVPFLAIFVLCVISVPMLAWKAPSEYKGEYGQTWTDERIKPPRAPITHQDYAGVPLGYTPIQAPLLPPPNAGTILPPPIPAPGPASTPAPAPAPIPATEPITQPGKIKLPPPAPGQEKKKVSLSSYIDLSLTTSTDTAIAQ
jgi:hypothetical protein